MTRGCVAIGSKCRANPKSLLSQDLFAPSGGGDVPQPDASSHPWNAATAQMSRPSDEGVVLSEHDAPLPIQWLYPASRLLSAKLRAFIDLAATRNEWRFSKAQHARTGGLATFALLTTLEPIGCPPFARSINSPTEYA
jgi:hypothetical protein